MVTAAELPGGAFTWAATARVTFSSINPSYFALKRHTDTVSLSLSLDLYLSLHHQTTRRKSPGWCVNYYCCNGCLLLLLLRRPLQDLCSLRRPPLPPLGSLQNCSDVESRLTDSHMLLLGDQKEGPSPAVHEDGGFNWQCLGFYHPGPPMCHPLIERNTQEKAWKRKVFSKHCSKHKGSGFLVPVEVEVFAWPSHTARCFCSSSSCWCCRRPVLSVCCHCSGDKVGRFWLEMEVSIGLRSTAWRCKLRRLIRRVPSESRGLWWRSDPRLGIR